MIPKKIHYCWVGDAPYPELVENCIKSWHEFMPGYEFILWNESKVDINKNSWIKEAYEARKYAFVADYIRFYALYTEGGIYFDTDVQMLKDLSPLLTYQSFIGYEPRGDIESAIIGAYAGTTWIGDCLEYYKDRHFRKYDGALDIRSVPDVIESILNTKYKIPKRIIKQVTVAKNGLALFPAEYFSPKNNLTKKIEITQNTYTIHHFDNSWIDKNSFFYVKRMIHKIIFLFFGEKLYNAIIKKVRKKGF